LQLIDNQGDCSKSIHLKEVIVALDVFLHTCSCHVYCLLVLELFDDLVDHSAKFSNWRVEQLGYEAEQLYELFVGKLLAVVKDVDEFGENLLTLAWIQLIVVEGFSCENDLIFVDAACVRSFAIVAQIILATLDYGLDHVYVVHVFD